MHILEGGCVSTKEPSQLGWGGCKLEEAFPYIVSGVREELRTLPEPQGLLFQEDGQTDILMQTATEGFNPACSLLSAAISGIILT